LVTLALDRNELGAFLVAAGLSSNRDHIFGVVAGVEWAADSEALGSDIEHLNAERGHRTQRVARDGGKQLTIPLAPRTARAIDLPIVERATPAAHIVHSQRQGRRSEPAVGRVRVINRIVH
jgi:phosphopantothenate synthetase